MAFQRCRHNPHVFGLCRHHGCWSQPLLPGPSGGSACVISSGVLRRETHSLWQAGSIAQHCEGLCAQGVGTTPAVKSDPVQQGAVRFSYKTDSSLLFGLSTLLYKHPPRNWTNLFLIYVRIFF